MIMASFKLVAKVKSTFLTECHIFRAAILNMG